MKILQITWYTFLRKIRDRQESITGVILPILLIFILGSALQGGFTSQDIGRIRVGYFNSDQKGASLAFEKFLEAEEVKEWLNIIPVNSYEDGIEKINSLEISSFIYIPNGYTENFMKANEASIQIIDTGFSSIVSGVVNNIVSMYNNGGNMAISLLDMQGKDLTSMGNPEKLQEILGENEDTQLLKRIALDGKEDPISSMNYYAITMLVMFSMWGAFNGSQGLSEDLFTAVKYRIQGAPISKLGYYTGKSLGLIASNFFNILIIIFFTKFAYGVNWGNQIAYVILIAFLLSMLSIQIGIFLSVIMKDESSVNTAINGIVVVSTFVAGGFMPLQSENPIFKMIQRISPNYHGQNAFINLIYNPGSREVFYSIGWILGMLILFTSMSVYFGRRKFSGYFS